MGKATAKKNKEKGVDLIEGDGNLPGEDVHHHPKGCDEEAVPVKRSSLKVES